MKDFETAQILEEGEATDFSLIDASASDDDFLLASSSDFSSLGNPDDIQAERLHMNHPSNSVEVQPSKKNGKCNLRKSLAWDSAFFTSAGVLDAEELSSIIEGAETSVKQKHFLPGIEEDLSKSYDSASTFESDSLTLDSLEADLFCDIRASIQRTSRLPSQGNCSSTKKQGETRSTIASAAKTADISPVKLVRPKLASKQPNHNLHGPSRILKPGSSKQAAKPAVKSKESKLLPRLPEAAAKPSLIRAAATKRTPVSTGSVKLESSTTGNPKGKLASSSKASYSVNSRNTVPKIPASSKLSSGASALGRAAPMRSSSSSCGSSSGCSSETVRKSQCDVNRRKMDKNINVSSGPKIGGPSRVAVKSKCRVGDSNVSDYLKTVPKISSSISPTSSISEWSTESSCSTTTATQKSITLSHCPFSQDTGSSVPQSHNQCFRDGASGVHDNQLAGWLDQSVKQPSTVRDISISHPVAKPSGLRLPSAKIGYFDGVKGAEKTPCGNSRSHSAIPRTLPRSRALNGSPSETANKLKAFVKPEARTRMNFNAADLEDQSIDLTETLKAHVTETLSKISGSVSLDSALADNSKVLSGVNHVADLTTKTTEKVKLVPAHKGASPGGKSHLSSNQATISAEDLHNITQIAVDTKDPSTSPSSKEGQSNRKQSSSLNSVCPSKEVDEYDISNITSVHACHGVGRSVGNDTTNENQDSGCEPVEVKQNFPTSFGTFVEATNNEMEMPSKSNGECQSQNLIINDNSLCVASLPVQLCDKKSTQEQSCSETCVQRANVSASSLSLLSLEATTETKTPFSVKNSVASLIKVFNSSPGPAVDPSVKFDILPSVEEIQKENC